MTFKSFVWVIICNHVTSVCMQRTAWIALPLAAVSRDREAIIRVQLTRPLTSSSVNKKQDDARPEYSEADVVVEPTAEWSDVTTRETIIGGFVRLCVIIVYYIYIYIYIYVHVYVLESSTSSHC